MAKYTDQFGNITEVGVPELNPDLIKGLTQVPDTTPFKNSTITSSNLSAKTSNFQSPTPIITPDISKLDTTVPEMKATAPEIQANDLTARLQAINDQLTGQSAFRSTQEAKQGLSEMLKTQTDLSARLKGLQNEALSIPLQFQQGAEGRGITTGGLAPIQTGALRENAIKALSVSSMLEASRGNITLANDLVDRAVNAQYAPLLEEQKAKLANLDLILKSPAYSLADKNRANAQKVLEEAKKTQLEQAQKDKDEILKTIAIPASQNATNFVSDGTPAHATLALTLDAISKAKTPQEALQIATANGLTTKKEAGFELSPGQRRFDAKGNLIASVPEKRTEEEIKKADYATADKLIKIGGGVNATYEQYKNSILQNTTSLNSTEIDTYLASQGIVKEKDIKPEKYFTAKNITDTAKALVDTYGNEAIKSIEDTGKLELSNNEGKSQTYTLSKEQISSISEEIKKYQLIKETEKLKQNEKSWWQFWK